jgi:UDP-glucose 4-epimerase
MPKSLVTGCAGFIGSHVADHLLSMRHDVVGLDDLSGGFRENNPTDMIFVEGSITDPELVTSLFAKYDFDYVFHLAAYAAEGLSHFIKRFNYENNLIGSVNLINAAVNSGDVKCFVFASSIAVYGAGQSPMDEDMVPAPEDPYGIAKFAVEMDLAEAKEIFDLDYIIFRPHNVYGERQNIGDRYRNVIGIFINQAMRGQPMSVFGDGQQTRAFSYISDVAPIIAESVTRHDAYNETFNVGADQPYSILAVAETVSRLMGVEKNVTHLAPRNEVVHAFSSHEKIKEHFGDLLNNVSLEKGLASMIPWAREHGPRTAQKFQRVEVLKNMPPSWKAELLEV